MDPSFANSTFQSKITEAADIVVGTCYMVFGKSDFMVHMFIELLLCLVQQREVSNFERNLFLRRDKFLCILKGGKSTG